MEARGCMVAQVVGEQTLEENLGNFIMTLIIW